MVLRKVTRKGSDELVDRWKHRRGLVQKIMDDIYNDEDWTRNIVDLPLVSSCSREKLPTESAPRDLRGIRLTGLDLTDRDALAETSLDGAILDGVVLTGAALNGISLRGSVILPSCVLDGASLQFADLVGAVCSGVSMQNCDFTGSNINGANFQDSDVRGCAFRGIKYEEEGAFGFLRRKNWTRFGGEYQKSSDLGVESDPLFVQYVSGENLRRLVELRHPFLAKVWYTLANFGRSPARLIFWVVVVWLLFGTVYASYPVPGFLQGSYIGGALVSVSPKINWSGVDSRSPSNGFEPYYFSAVTFATLGYGDTHPAPTDWKGEVYVCVEVFLGYIILGLFVSILIQNAYAFRT